MQENRSPQPIFLKDYKIPPYLIDSIDLVIDLEESHTHVSSKMHIYRNPQANTQSPFIESPLILNGEQMKLLSVKLDGKKLSEANYTLTEKTLSIHQVPPQFTLEIENEINPSDNKALEGLYKSHTTYCTQNEPEGFRRITYFIDRPDVMAKYSTKIIADKKLYPILLSNGNEIGKGDLPNGKHWVLWQDPFPKPCYLFAMVAGDLGGVFDVFTTKTGRKIDLRIYCEKGNEPKCLHAMESLKKSMLWDEELFGLEYDLDIYMIVAVDFFNMGAMENKGLNIFNTRCVLADPASATDENFNLVEAVIAHEYFHNWTGNRVTCRDWFQLTLKEGLTVFRDQEFTSDHHSRAVKRIEDVIDLRQRQFEEDAGPTAHPIKPESYIQMNNFYTTTVYNKGSEVIRMIRTLIGKTTFRKGIDKYFELFDGQAVTTEDFVHAMELASGRDLHQFTHWYHQAGTPELHFQFDYNPIKKEFAIAVEQICPNTPERMEKKPFHMPLIVALLGKDGKEILLHLQGSSNSTHSGILEITQAQQTFVFENVNEKPLPSINREFSAPVKIHAPFTTEDYLFLMAHDTDSFNRWEAGQQLGIQIILNLIDDMNEGRELILDSRYIEAFGVVLKDLKIDKSLKAMALTLPSEISVGQYQDVIDFDGIHLIREFILAELGRVFFDDFKKIYGENQDKGPYKTDHLSVSRRNLKNLSLRYMMLSQSPEVIAMCMKQFKEANNMTDELAALQCLSHQNCPERQEALDLFYRKWKQDTLVMNKWLAVQALSKVDGTLQRVEELISDSVFDSTVPNLVRSLFTSFAHNHIHFHANNGEGYALIVDQIIKIDRFNPQLASHLAKEFKKIDKLDSVRKKAMKKHLERIIAVKDLSSNVYEIISKCLAS